MNVLLEKNPEVRSKIDSENAVFDLVFTKKDFYSNTQTAVVKCSPCIRSGLIEKGNVFIDCDHYPCLDHLFVFQCFHCASFGHSSSRCPRKNKYNLRCFFCAAKGDHDSDPALQNRTLISMLAATAWPLLITRLAPLQLPIQRILNNVLFT